MTERHYTLAGHHVAAFDGIWSLPCLAGEDCSRKIGEILIEPIPGGFRCGSTGGVITVTPGETLRGWGLLDGPSYHLQPEDCAWYVSVPVPLWDAVCPMISRGE